MRALVTGAYGYVGGHLVCRLIQEGWHVTTLDSMFKARDWNFPDGVARVRAHTANIDAVIRAMNGVTAVFHLAGRGDWRDELRHPVRLEKTNVTGTTTVLAAARKIGVDNVIVSSSYEVYGNVLDATETGPTHPLDMYGATKLAGEKVCEGFVRLGMNIKVLRLFEVWGGRFGDSPVDQLVKGEIVDGIDKTLDFVHISDVIDAMVAALHWEPSIYNIGTGDEVLVSGLGEMFGCENGKYESGVDRCFANMEYTKQAAGWEANVRITNLSCEKIQELCRWTL